MEDDKIMLCAANSYIQKYFFNPEYDFIPDNIKKDIRVMCVTMAHKLSGIFSIGFYSDGSVFLDSTADENDFGYDDIGAKLEISRLEREQRELFKSLSFCYVYKTTQKG